jgi:hypothetical protein
MQRGLAPMSKVIIQALIFMLFCLASEEHAVGAQDGYFYTTPPFVFRTPPDLGAMMADRPAGFCIAKTTDDRAYLLVGLSNTNRTIDATERALDRLALDLGVEADHFICPPDVVGRMLLKLLSQSGKEFQEFVVPDELLGASEHR